MKKILVTSTCLTLLACAPQLSRAKQIPTADSAAPQSYGQLLEKYVNSSGVRYAAWHSNQQDMQALRDVVDFYSSTLPPEDKNESLAWHLNAYNAWILNNILAKYPTDGPLDNETFFFHGNRIKISGKKTSFDHLEQKVIRPVFNEPQIHFALNCAAESCPPLHNKPFSGKTLDTDLKKLTSEFINRHSQGVVLDKGTVRVSKIFDWYKDDFDGKQGIIPYINRYRTEKIPADAKLEFFDYSWQLNQSK